MVAQSAEKAEYSVEKIGRAQLSESMITVESQTRYIMHFSGRRVLVSTNKVILRIRVAYHQTVHCRVVSFEVAGRW